MQPYEELYALLTAASRKLAELKGIAAMLPNQSIFVNTIALREAKASQQSISMSLLQYKGFCVKVKKKLSV